ncbi:TauD/TfdA family dioxygenase [Francisellaceae bacterium]|nr:TauD/TfdA family dioxygenase [Francisellaceae bacterium]
MKTLQNKQIPASKMGRVITDVDLANLDAAGAEKIKQAVSECGAVNVKGPNLLPDQLDAMTSKIGDIVTLPEGLAFDNQVQGLETVVRISNIRKDGTLIKSHKGAEYWHQDGDFRPGKGIYVWNLLHSHTVPSQGGETGFLDAQRVLQIIPKWLNDFFASHKSKLIPSKIPDFDKETASKISEVLHNCIQKHPVTNAESLYLGSISVTEMDGIPNALWKEILAYLMECFDKEENRYIHKWESGDTLIWDNTLVYHRSMGGYGDEPRLLYRTQAMMFQK